MFLHVGGDRLVRIDDIVGIFDADICMRSKDTRDFLALAKAEKKLTSLSTEADKTFLVTTNMTYSSPISTHTLARRIPTAAQCRETGDGQESQVKRPK